MDADDPDYFLCSSVLDEDICCYLDDYERKQNKLNSPQSLFSDESPSPKSLEKRVKVTPEFKIPGRGVQKVSDFAERVLSKKYINVSSYIRDLKCDDATSTDTKLHQKKDFVETPTKPRKKPNQTKFELSCVDIDNISCSEIKQHDFSLDHDVSHSNDVKNNILMSDEPVPKDDSNSANKMADFNEEVCELKKWGLPAAILCRYHEMKITHMFPWQAECLSLGIYIIIHFLLCEVVSGESSNVLPLH